MNNKQRYPAHVQSRKAIAMIELIFAIVIIGITLLSVPNLINQASESGYTTIQQESIAAAASDLSLILSREWDEVGTTDAFHTPILTNAGASSLSTRPGGYSRTFVTSVGSALPASALGNDGGDMDDIDDAHNTTGIVTLIDGVKDLLDIDIAIATTVNYVVDTSDTGDNWNNTATLAFNTPFTVSAATSNIKQINITLTSSSSVAEFADKEISFTAFSSNIGSYKLERRELP